MAKPTAAESVPATKVNRRFGQLITDVLRGKSFTITRNGVPIARLVPVEPPTKDSGSLPRPSNYGKSPTKY